MNIAFYRVALIGDSVVSLHGIYALKCLYPHDRLVVFTNTIGENLYRQFDFIDVIVNISSMSEQEFIKSVNGFEFEFFLSPHCNRRDCKLFMQTNVKKIITFRTFWNFTKLRFKTIFIPRMFVKMPMYKRILKLAYRATPPPLR